MKFLLVVAAILAVSQAAILDLDATQWMLFKSNHGRNYANEAEEKQRMGIFLKNAKKIAEHNDKYEKGLVSFKAGFNQYADMEHHEFVAKLNGFNRTTRTTPAIRGAAYVAPANQKLPKSVDWRTQGAVTPVKNQGQCGSCWSFSATGSLEGQHFRKTGKLVSLSEQNLVDCSLSYGNAGCMGGWMDYAFQYIKDNKGIDTEKSYPYEAIDDSCRYTKANEGADDVGFVDIQAGSEAQLQSAVASIGPVSVAMDAGHQSFQFYSGGIYIEPYCSATFLDHGVLAVGYGTENGQDYWIVKNSWGTTWGEEGYFKLARNKDNHCGVATKASYPLV